MKKIILCLVLVFSSMPNSYASDINIINQSTKTVNVERLIKLSENYKKLVLKYWKVSDIPLNIYLVDFWDPGVIGYLDISAQGYHSYNESGPYIVINMSNTNILSMALTHEIAETLINPYIDKYVYYKGKKIYMEISDPTIDIFYIGYSPVSDFAFPSFYKINGKAPYSYTRSLKKPFLTNSGYVWNG